MVAAAKPAAIVLVLYLSTVVAVVAAAVASQLRRPFRRLQKEVAKPHPERETKIPPFASSVPGRTPKGTTKLFFRQEEAQTHAFQHLSIATARD